MWHENSTVHLILWLVCRGIQPEALKTLMMGGFAVQVRAIAVNITYLAVTRATIEMDPSGTSAAAHTISVQLWPLGTIIQYSLSSLATIFVPRALNKKDLEGVRS